MWRSRFESNSGSYAGRIAPPGMPKTTSTPSSSSERTSDCAPVSSSAVTTGLPGGGCGGEQSHCNKKPPRAEHGGASAQATERSAGAPRDYYEKALHAATVANLCKRCQAGETGVSLCETAPLACWCQPQTAPTDADWTSFAYLASTPRV